MRIEKKGVLSFTYQMPVLPPHGVTSLKLRSLHLLGSTFSVFYDDKSICVTLLSEVFPLEIRTFSNNESSISRSLRFEAISFSPLYTSLFLNKPYCFNLQGSFYSLMYFTTTR